ncbi:MAG: chromosome segregation protein SMC, partial [Ferroplasma sp.]
GSGKSNIGDGILFVLGIRSNKTVRVDRLEDFIHKSNPPKKRCYVTLNVITDDNSKYSIKRELVSSNGDFKSNYFINGKHSTRNDVSKLIDSFHIYLDGYSFVLQGDINNLVKMSGAERRKLLESIAGIESYKERIDSAQSDIDGLNENLNRMDAIIGEIKTVLDTLEVDRENALKYNKLHSEIEELRLFLKVKDRERIKEELGIYNGNIEKASNDIKQLEQSNADLSEMQKNTENEMEKIEILLNEIGGNEIIEVRKRIEELNILIAQLTTKTQTYKETKINSESRLKATSDALNFTLEQLDKKNREKANYESYLRAANKNIEKINAELDQFRKENYENSKVMREINGRMGEIDGIMQEKNEELINNNEINEIDQKLSSYDKALSMEEDRSKDDLLKIKDLKWKIENLKNNIRGYTDELADINRDFIKFREQLNELSVIKSKNDITIREKEKELRGLNYRSGASPAIKEINSIMETQDGIYGQLKDLLEYDDKYSSAVIVSAGGRLNSIIVDSDMIAQECIEILKSKRLGRLTFVPLNKIVAPPDHLKSQEIVKAGDAIAFMRDLVSYDKKFEKAVRYGFGDTVLMDTLEKARKFMNGIRIVTLEGDIIEPSGAMSGGSIKNDEIIANRIIKSINEMEEQGEILKSQIEASDKKVKEVSMKLADLTRKRDIDASNLSNYEQQLSDSEARTEGSDVRISAIKKSILEANERKNALEARKKEIKLELLKLQKEKESLYKKLNDINPENVEIEKQMESDLETARKTAEGYSNTIVGLNTEIANFKEKKGELSQKIDELNDEIEKTRLDIENNNKSVENLDKELTEKRNKEFEIDSRSKELYTKKSELKSKIDDIINQLRKNDDLINNKNTIISTLNVKVENMALQLDTLNYEIENSGIEVPQINLSINEINNIISADERKIVELGAVNMRAIEQYDTELNKYNDTKSKYDTLLNEKNDLIELQNSIIEDEKTVFLDLYDTINMKFKEIYRRLSEGGEASLELTSREDPLNAEIYIKATPNGTHMIKIDALSGGEKSVAVLSLIAAFQVKNPSPIYYLDEVDMFLDGHNAEHVGDLFRENSKIAQVVMVSLKGAVSKFADNIIGVTVDKDGNTRIVQKRLKDDDGEE